MGAQIQGLQSDDIRLLNGLGIQGVRRKVYLWGTWSGLVRSLQKGNDLMVFPDGSEWKVAYVFEDFGHGASGATGWCSVAVVLQNPLSEDTSPAPPPPVPPPVQPQPIPSYVELGELTAYTLADGAYKDQRVRIIDNLFLGGQVITGNFNVGSTITFNQPGQWIDPFWDGAQWVVGSFGGVL